MSQQRHAYVYAPAKWQRMSTKKIVLNVHDSIFHSGQRAETNHMCTSTDEQG